MVQLIFQKLLLVNMIFQEFKKLNLQYNDGKVQNIKVFKIPKMIFTLYHQ